MEVKHINITPTSEREKLALYDVNGDGILGPLEQVMMKYDVSAPFGNFSIAEVKAIVNDLDAKEKANRSLKKMLAALSMLLLLILGVNMALTFVVVDLSKETESSGDGVQHVRGKTGPDSIVKTGTVVDKVDISDPKQLLAEASFLDSNGHLESTKRFNFKDDTTAWNLELAGYEIFTTPARKALERDGNLVTLFLHTTSAASPMVMISGVVDDDGKVSNDGYLFYPVHEMPDKIVEDRKRYHITETPSDNGRKLLFCLGAYHCNLVNNPPPCTGPCCDLTMFAQFICESENSPPTYSSRSSSSVSSSSSSNYGGNGYLGFGGGSSSSSSSCYGINCAYRMG
mmetsp:Transcript_10872/g.12806  ORF Transcript_10872/g.12806 Transcript_10872/m.12806 type:complete len:342 (+) Transcript_10872:96-1121(+)|eukprot:CAMPEP_0197843478 /NCGR_PEP_ID=MMETSP1438-20131217/358_1 /TAXON_ID=1461541 /ORGANISM="Pterosperma sp., Strain CCMP1384" /LENGTH=341 /DNA_ID=CAMNT_0043453659 /DNA_START=56 /DNA_END=1081 /DNA_ORIENTATION=+